MTNRKKINDLLYEADKKEKMPFNWKMDFNTLCDLRVELSIEELRYDDNDKNWKLCGFPIEIVEDRGGITLEMSS